MKGFPLCTPVSPVVKHESRVAIQQSERDPLAQPIKRPTAVK